MKLEFISFPRKKLLLRNPYDNSTLNNYKRYDDFSL